MKILKRLKTRILWTILAISCSGCASQLPTFAHVHVGHSLSAWVNTPQKKGLFILTEEFGEDIARLAVSLESDVSKGHTESVAQLSRRLIDLVGETDAVISGPEDYRFLSALKGAVSHLDYSKESPDSSQNLREGLTELLEKTDQIFIRAELISTIAEEIPQNQESDRATLAAEIKSLAVLNFEGNNKEFGLRQLRNELFDVLDREQPAYTAPERKYLFGVIRLPNGSWFWKFKNSDSGGGDYGQFAVHDDTGGGGTGGY